MVDLAKALESFQDALKNDLISCEKCMTYPNLFLHEDDADGRRRYTFSRILSGNAQAIVAFIPVDSYEGFPCLQIGYAVDPKLRHKGIGGRLVAEALLTLEKHLKKNSDKTYFVEAVVGVNNEHSNRIALKHISAHRKQIICQVSGEDAFQYIRKF